MKQFKKTLILPLVLSCLAVGSLAENLPDAQFGVDVWPYPQEISCETDAPEIPPVVRPTEPIATATPRPQATQAPSVTAIPTAVPTRKPTGSNGTGDYTTDSVTAQEYYAWNLLNEDRIANGLAPLQLDQELSRIARIKSEDMNANNYFAHESPTYGNAANMLRLFGYSFNGVGENIAHHATVLKAQAAFMSSSGHRANILGSQWSKVGIGVSYDKNGSVYVTQIFVR